MLRTAYLGPAGTFSHEAVGLVAELLDALPCPSIRAAVLSVQRGEAQRGVVPIENSLEGGVGATLDTLVREAPDVVLCGEVLLPVQHCLVARAGSTLAGVREVWTHPQASAQCARFLAETLPGVPVLPAPSTADAIRSVLAGSAPAAAIGSRHAAALYGGAILAERIEDVRDGNETRFVVLAGSAAGVVPPPTGPGPFKTALTFSGSGAGESGWLVRCLSEFAFRGVNLTRIESRPSRRGLGSYRFFLDLEGAIGSEAVDGAVRSLTGAAEEVRVLGSYAMAAHGAVGA